MKKPFDLSKFRKDITKSIEGLSIGFHDPTDWISTGNYALNYLISSDFKKGVPLGKVTVFAGESGSGKSFICSGNLVKNAQAQGIYVVLIDSENALDETWLHALDVDTSEDKLLKLNMAMIDDVAKTISTFVKDYKTLAEADRPKVLFVIDSLGMLMTPVQVDQFESGGMKGDMGHKPRALKSLVTNCVNMFGSLGIGLVATNHTYASQDMYNPDPVVSGGAGFVFASSILVAMKKLKLKEDEDGNKVTDVLGIRAGCKIMKTRYAKPFEDIQIQIPYETGMNPYSGLFDLFEKREIIKKEGNRYTYVDLNGEVHKYYRKEWNRNENSIMDLVMDEFADKEKLVAKTLVIDDDLEDDAE
jgi:recombination protein RecA